MALFRTEAFFAGIEMPPLGGCLFLSISTEWFPVDRFVYLIDTLNFVVTESLQWENVYPRLKASVQPVLERQAGKIRSVNHLTEENDVASKAFRRGGLPA